MGRFGRLSERRHDSRLSGQAALALDAANSLESHTFLFDQLSRTGQRQMANSAQARKRARQADAARAHNASLRSRLRTAIKAVRKAVTAGDKDAAQAVYRASTKVIDSIADKKIIHKNKAARHKSRLSAAIKSMMVSA
jgi:small subunit ribosomal protein S20